MGAFSVNRDPRTMRFHLLASALVAVSLANEDVFLNWAKEQGRQYHTKAEVTKRQAIFMKNYNRMVEHNKEFAAGRVSWARGVNQWYDLTEEEWFAEMGFGAPENPKQNTTSSSFPSVQRCSTEILGLEGLRHRLTSQEPEELRQLRRFRHRRRCGVLLCPEDRCHHRPLRGAPGQLPCHQWLLRLVRQPVPGGYRQRERR